MHCGKCTLYGNLLLKISGYALDCECFVIQEDYCKKLVAPADRFSALKAARSLEMLMTLVLEYIHSVPLEN